MKLLRSLLGIDRAAPDLERHRGWILALVVLVAAALRFSLIGSARFSGDEGWCYEIARRIAHFEYYPVLGPPITGGQAALPGSLFFVSMAIPQWFWNAPESCMVFTAIEGTLSVALAYLAMRRPFGEAGAAFAGLLLACSPWAAFATDRIANALMLPNAVAIYCACKLRENPRSPLLALFLVACATMPQMHLSFPMLWAALVVLVVSTVSRWRWRWLALGLVLSLTLYAPYIVSEYKTHAANLHAYVAESRGGRRTEGTWRFVSVYSARILSLDTSYFENTGYWGEPNETANLRTLREGSRIRPKTSFRTITLYASGAALLLAFVAIAFESTRRARALGWRRFVTPFGLATLTALAANTALIAYAGKPVFGHYVQPIQLFLYFVYGSLGLVAMRYRWTRVPALALLVLFCAGGIEATRTISTRLDGRVGIRVERGVLFKMMRDAIDEGYPDSEPVRLEFGFYASPYWYQQASHLVGDDRVRLEGFAPRRQYRVQVVEDLPPPNWDRTEAPHFVGPVALYRLRSAR